MNSRVGRLGGHSHDSRNLTFLFRSREATTHRVYLNEVDTPLPPIPDILDPQCPVDGLAQYPARPGPPGKHKVFVLDRRPREDATMQTHERDPLRFPARPAERFQCFLPATQVENGGAKIDHRAAILSRVRAAQN